MTRFSSRKHRVAAVITAATVAVGGGSAAIVAATASASPATATLAAATAPATARSAGSPGWRHRRRLVARTDHATFEVKAKGRWITIDLDRGKVTNLSSASITLLRPDGQSVTEQITSTTHFHGVTSAATVRTGARASVISEDGTARQVVQAAHAKGATSTTGGAAATSNTSV